MSRRTPFLMGIGPDVAAETECGGLTRGSTIYSEKPPPRPAAQAAVTDDFRNSRRGARRICTPPCTAGSSQLDEGKLGQLIHPNLRIPHLGGLHEFVPGDLASLIRPTHHHARKSRLSVLGRLVMEIAAGQCSRRRPSPFQNR